jgi:hypothetical protein
MADEQQQVDVWSMTPEQAGAKLAELKVAYDAANGPPAPRTPGSARLREMLNDPKIRDAYLSGAVPAITREINELKAAGAQFDTGGIEVVDGVTDPLAVSKREYATLIDGLREHGGLDVLAEDYLRHMDAGGQVERPTSGDAVAARLARSRLTKDTSFVQKFLSGDVAATSMMGALARMEAWALDDGRPVSEEFAKFLKYKGLR